MTSYSIDGSCLSISLRFRCPPLSTGWPWRAEGTEGGKGEGVTKNVSMGYARYGPGCQRVEEHPNRLVRRG